MEILDKQVLSKDGHQQLMIAANSILPTGYIQLEWLDNNVQYSQNAAAYVNTGISGLDGRTSRIEIDAVWKYAAVSGSPGWNILFVAQASDNDSGTIQIRVSNSTGTSTGATLISNLNDVNSINVNAGVPFHAVLDKSLFTVNNETTTTICGTTVSKGPLYIGKPQWDRGSEFRYWMGLLGRCTVYDNETLVGDMIPALQTADNTYGYYDVARNVFLPSSNSIPFKEGSL